MLAFIKKMHELNYIIMGTPNKSSIFLRFYYQSLPNTEYIDFILLVSGETLTLHTAIAIDSFVCTQKISHIEKDIERCREEVK